MSYEYSEIVLATLRKEIVEIYNDLGLGSAFIEHTALMMEKDIRYRVYRIAINIFLFHISCSVNYTYESVEDSFSNTRFRPNGRLLFDSILGMIRSELIDYMRDPRTYLLNSMQGDTTSNTSIDAQDSYGVIVEVPMVRLLRE